MMIGQKCDLGSTSFYENDEVDFLGFLKNRKNSAIPMHEVAEIRLNFFLYDSRWKNFITLLETKPSLSDKCIWVSEIARALLS